MRRKIITMAMSMLVSSFLMTNAIYADTDKTEVLNQQEITEQATTMATTETVAESTTSSSTTTATEKSKSSKVTTKRKKTSTKKSKKSRRKKGKKSKESQRKTKPTTKVAPGAVRGASVRSKKNRQYLGKYIYFNQGDAVWNDSGLSIRSSGCGPTAMAVCITNLKKWTTPVDTAAWALEQGLYSSSGSVHHAIPAMAEHWGLKCRGLRTEYAAIKKTLQQGNMVVGLMGPGYFTGKGHFITLLEIDENDKVLVADVGSRARSAQKYDLKYVISQSKAAEAGGPFWSIEKKHSVKHRGKVDKKSVKSKLEEKERKVAVQEFYKQIDQNSSDFEKKIPIQTLLQGRKIQNQNVIQEKINQYIDKLGTKLDSPYLKYVARHYQFGEESLKNCNLEVDCIDLNQIILLMQG